MRRQVVESEYIDYEEKSEWNGYSKLNIDKIECIISYFAERVRELHKIKLMKLPWYVDMINYKKHGKSITGLVYRHYAMGALPIGHDEIIELDNVIVDKVEEYETVKYEFYPNEDLDMSTLDNDDKTILDMVVFKFGDFSTRDIVEYIHKEKAYIDIEDMQVISYAYAEEIQI